MGGHFRIMEARRNYWGPRKYVQVLSEKDTREGIIRYF